MSTFAAFFPAAPRAAKEKAKEREMPKPQTIESPISRPNIDARVSTTNSRVGDATFHPSIKETSAVAFASAASGEDNESPPGDILNGVGSASSHASTVSSVFSAPALPSNMPSSGVRHVCSLTPLTNTESSPLRIPSPNQTKPGAPSQISNVYSNEQPQVHNDALHAHQILSDPRVHARDQIRGIKGSICIYDPLLDRKIGSNEKKKAKPIYREFGLVCILDPVGSVIFFA
jgi:[histone H3]-lysine4 N-trimethyltransferase SETD1